MERPKKGCGIEEAKRYQESLRTDLQVATERLQKMVAKLQKKDVRLGRIKEGKCPKCGHSICQCIGRGRKAR